MRVHKEEAVITTPVYSHGGTSSVPGTGAGAGQAIDVTSAHGHAAIFVGAAGTGTAVVIIEASGAPIDSTTHEPLAADWVDTTNGGISITGGASICKKVMVEMPYWRTRIVSLSSGMSVRSYIPLIRSTADGHASAANHITVIANATEGM